MPKVKGRRTKQKAPRGGRRGARRKAARSPFDPVRRFFAFLETYALAGAAGAVVLIGTAVLVLAAGGYVTPVFERLSAQATAAVDAATRNAGFEVRRVTLRGGHQTAHQEILDALDAPIGASLFAIDLGAARARVEALGWVRAASVSRLWPDAIHVSIRERRPAAVWQLDGDLTLIDAAGAPIRPVNAYEYSYLPMIVGVGAPDAAAGVLEALNGAPAVAERATALVRVGERRWNVRLKGGVDLKLPSENYAAALAEVDLLQADGHLLDGAVCDLDFRDPERVVVRPCVADDPRAAL
ncbi:MAG: cell division protein FtsQ/DivIB [Parvularculaceae bacterium]